MSRPKPSKPPDRCGPTRKIRFKSHSHAISRASEILASRSARTPHFRAYLCPYCNGWHLSSH